MRFKTAHEIAEETCRRHRREEGDVEVTASTFPELHEAFEAISHDSGYSAGHESYFVPSRWEGHLASVEQLLGTINLKDGTSFVLGEASEIEALVQSRPELAPANDLLNAFFDYFCEDEG